MSSFPDFIFHPADLSFQSSCGDLITHPFPTIPTFPTNIFRRNQPHFPLHMHVLTNRVMFDEHVCRRDNRSPRFPTA